ncbi:MAG TPA: carboxypeptidase regulatory-like domain-containing protein [Verrucomicrobiae bacterium]
MKTFQKFLLSLLLGLSLNVRAATNDAAQFSGTVVDAQGNPVANAAVDCYQYSSRINFGSVDMEVKQHATTDGQGVFAFPAFHGTSLVVVTKQGIAPTWRTWYNGAPQESQKIVVSASSKLAGVVADDAGRPVADAEVWVSSALNKTVTDMGPNFVFGKTARELFSTRTSADGQFHIENFPADAQASLSVKKAGLAQHQAANSLPYDQLPFHAGQEDITLTLDPAGSVTGKVTTRDNGQPLASAVIGLQSSSQGNAADSSNLSGDGTNMSAADGSFQISDVPAGAYQVVAEFTNAPIADWVVDSVPITVAVGQAVSGVQLQAYKGGVVEVTVRGKSGHELLADAGVSLNNQDFNRSGATGTNGVAYFRLPPGQYNVYVNKPDWSQAQDQATVTDGQTTQVSIDLPEPLKISGVVRDSTGAPVSGVSVGVVPNYGNGGTGATTDANGHYDVSWQLPTFSGQMSISFFLVARDPDRKLAAIQPIDDAATNLDVTLKPAMNLSGRIQDPNGRPITNAMAYVMIYQEDSSYSISSRERIFADEQGRIHADALPLGQRYGWYVNASGYGSAQQQMDAADLTADHFDLPPLVLKPANRKLAGRVLDAKGKPAAGVQIWMQGEGQPNGNATTDSDGRFIFDAVCEGPVNISANLKGAYGSSQAMGGDTNVVIRFESGNQNYIQPAEQTLTGTVYDSSGNPAAGVRVVVSPSMGRTDIAKTDDSGGYSVSWAAQQGMRGTKYFAIARDVDRNLAAIGEIGTGKTSVNLHLAPALSISGTVLDASGAPLPHANVNLNIMAGNMGGMVENQRIKLKSDGTFTIPALPMGQRYWVMVSANGYGTGQKNVGVAQSQTNSLQLAPFKLKTANVQLAGQVLDAKGKPLPGAQLYLNGKGQPNVNATSDETGHFHFKVCGGPVQIYAWSQGGQGRNDSANVNAIGGDTNVIVKMGAQQRQSRQVVVREIPLKPQPWTPGALVAWLTSHKTGAIALLSLQAAVLLGTGGGIFWISRKRG